MDWPLLKAYISYLEDSPNISAYTITNGMVNLAESDWKFLEDHKINVGFSIDGYRELHNLNRCDSFDRAMETVEYYKQVTGHYPTFNATVGRDSLENADGVIAFFKPLGTRVTFSRMIGRYGISLQEYRDFLDNAEKYTPEGGKARVSLQRAGSRIRLTVSNTGDPIPPEERKKLFQRFYRADPARSGRKGFGLGLSIARTIAEHHKGRLTVDSREGWNSFTLELRG